MSMEATFATYATKRIADLETVSERMESGALRIIEQAPDGEPNDTTQDTLAQYARQVTLGANRAELEAIESPKGQIETGASA